MSIPAAVDVNTLLATTLASDAAARAPMRIQAAGGDIGDLHLTVESGASQADLQARC